MSELKIGQKLWVRYRGFDRRRDSKAEEVEITKIGRKYFDVEQDGYNRGKYEIETMMQAVDSNYRNKAYLSIEEINEEDEISKLSNEITTAFRTYGNLPYSLEQLRAISKIITPNS